MHGVLKKYFTLMIMKHRLPSIFEMVLIRYTFLMTIIYLKFKSVGDILVFSHKVNHIINCGNVMMLILVDSVTGRLLVQLSDV